MRLFPLPASWAALMVLSTVLANGSSPDDPLLSADYEVTANGKAVTVYGARVLDAPFAGKEWNYGGNYAFANFDLAGRAMVRIRSRQPVRNTVVRPAGAVRRLEIADDHTLVLTLDKPAKFSVEPDGKKGPLLLFANPPETRRPRPGAPGVVYYGPGVHQAGRIVLTNRQTLYLAAGAVVKGGVMANGEDIRICGRGILDSSDYEWRKGPTPHVISIRGTNVELSGITIRGASHWTIVPRDSRKVLVKDVKICGSRVQNDDGINPCNSREVRIADCFIRSDDDCVAMKGLELGGLESNVERVTVENCVLWCDRARIFLLGHESRAPYMREIKLRNLDIIHFTMTPFLFEPGEEMRLEGVAVENVRLHGEGQAEFIRLKPVVNQYMRNKVPGVIRDIRFKNVSITGRPGPYKVQIEGADARHEVQGVALENVTVLGRPLRKDYPGLSIGGHTADIRAE